MGMTDKQMDARLKLLFDAASPRFYKGKHASTCKCYECMAAKVESYRARAKLAVQGGARPTYAEQTIPVRSHWRTGKNHLKNDPALRALVRSIVLEIMRESKRSH